MPRIVVTIDVDDMNREAVLNAIESAGGDVVEERFVHPAAGSAGDSEE